MGYTAFVTAASPTIPTLVDVATLLPPGRVSVGIAVAGSVSGDLVTVDGVPDGVLLGPGRVFLTTGVNASALAYGHGVTTEFQGMYTYRFSGTGTHDVYVTGYRW